ncbi:MAG: hypothetical protein HJJLKODD_00213 [Phycisphaerae bacterium]|nr:hypothetical protein [Phycisphaerae bacterium]
MAVSDDPPTTTAPSTSRPSSDEVEDILDEQRPDRPPLAPEANPNQTAPDEVMLPWWAQPQRDADLLWPEGYRLGRIQGVLQSGQPWPLFIFKDEDYPETPKKIAVLPNAHLEQMEAYLRTRPDVVFQVSADLTEYQEQNYLLVRNVNITQQNSAVTKSQPATTDSTSSSADAADNILDLMEEKSPTATPLEPDAMEPNDEPPAPASEETRPLVLEETSKLWPEGSLQVDRVGRLVREIDWWTFAFESQSDREGERSVRIVPNLALQEMERLSASGQRPQLFRITAEVTNYQGQAYFVIRRIMLLPPSDNLR